VIYNPSNKRHEVDQSNQRINSFLNKTREFLKLNKCIDIKCITTEMIEGFGKEFFYDAGAKYCKNFYLNEKTRKTSISIIKDFCDTMNDPYIEDIDIALVNEYVKIKSEKCNNNTINTKLKKLKVIFDKVTQNEVDNPFVLKLKKEQNINRKTLNLHEFQILRNANFINPELEFTRKLFCFITLCGSARFSDYIKIEIRNVDLKNNVVYLNEQKNKKEKFLVIDETYIEWVKCYYNNNKYKKYLFDVANKDGFNPESYLVKFNRNLKKISKQLNIPAITSHSNRYTFASLALNELNLNPFEIKLIMNHSNLSTTMDYINNDSIYKYNLATSTSIKMNSLFFPNTQS
jgi:integrase